MENEVPPDPGNRRWKPPRGQTKWLIDQKKRRLDILKNRLERSQNYSSKIRFGGRKLKFMSMYGLSSDRAAVLLLARRGLNLSERPLASYARLPPVDGFRHVWESFSQFSGTVFR